MPRGPRLDFPGARHHVMNRGARRAPTFHDDASCVLFLDALSALPARFGVRIHGYALMPNHYHLLLETPRANVSGAMRHLGGDYTVRLNRLHAWDGPVFRGRFRNRVVEDDAYWRHLLAYIHLNPVRANLVATVDDALWTSHAAYTGEVRTPDWLVTGELLDAFGGLDAYRAYVRDVHRGRAVGPTDFDPEALWVPSHTATAPAPSRPPRSADAALDRVCALTGETRAGLRESRRGRTGHPARWVAAWWLVRDAGLTQVQAAELLGAEPFLVARWLRRVRAHQRRDGLVRRWTDVLDAEGVVASPPRGGAS